MQTIDTVLNRLTMYRVVVYGLAAVLLVAEFFALTGTLAISAGGLLASTAALAAGCYGANRLFAWLARAAANSESWLITALILACIFPAALSPTRLGLLALAGAVAMGSKYVPVVRGSHIFNPAAAAAFVMSVTGLLPATWWIANPTLTPFLAILAFAVLRKQRRFMLFASFALSALLVLLFVSSLLHGQAGLATLRAAATSWPIIFLGSIMLTEPTTLPASRPYQLLFGVLVGVVFSSQLHLGRVAATPEAALLVGNLFTFVFQPAYGAMLRLKRANRLAPDIYEAVFERPAVFRFRAGQYLEWTLPHEHTDSRGNRRLFSVASSPNEPELRIAFRHYEPSSSFKEALLALHPGNYIRAAHIAGNFVLPDDPAKPLLLIAGGIGITPLRSMVQQLVEQGVRANIVLLYFANRESDFVYREVFEAAGVNGVQAQYIVGRPDEAVIAQAVPDLAQRTAYISGPELLVSYCRSLLRRHGVPSARIHTDHFAGY